MKTSLRGLGAALLLLAAAMPLATVSAGTISGSLSDYPAFSTTDFTNPATVTAWTIYGDMNGAPGGANFTALTWGGAAGSPFSALTLTGTSFGNYGSTSGQIKYQYTGGLGSYPGSMVPNGDNFGPKAEFAGGDTAAGWSLTHTLTGTAETINFVIQNGDAGGNLLASLSSGGTPYSALTSFTSQNGSYFGTLTLNVTGNIGDVLNFSIMDPGTGSNRGVIISSGSYLVTAVPEPGVCALLAVGSIAAASGLARRRRHS